MKGEKTLKIEVIDNENVISYENGILHLKDENEKDITCSISEIADISTDLPENGSSVIEDEVEEIKQHDMEICDSEGNKIELTTLLDELKQEKVHALDVTFEATHSGINKNFCNYVSESMSKDYETWLKPFAKPLIKNHDMYTEPIGRVIDASYNQSVFTDDRDCIDVTYRVTDADAMTKLVDGRYKTMSIGGVTNNITCNICGKQILKDGKFKFCGHWKGKEYKGKIATWTTQDIEYREGSIVNAPADMFAQVKKITPVYKTVKNADKEQTQENKEVKNSEQMNSEDVLKMIEDVLDNKKSNKADDKQEKSVEQQLKDAEEEKVKLQETIAELKNKISNYNETLQDKEKTIAISEATIQELEDKVKNQKENLVNLSKFNKQLLIDYYKYVNPNDKEDISDMTSIEINKKLKKCLDKETTKETEQEIEDKENNENTKAETLKYPGLVNNKEKQTIQDNDSDVVNSSIRKKNVDELLSSVIYK